ncbi:MAG: hypothetical protein O7B99_09070 [Planctomycetota bacterium]|nr:hypothetical protein [Planctomycetota bacterium]
MVRLVAFFAVAWVLAVVLGQFPIIGPFFRATGIFGVWITAILLSWLLTHYGNRAYVVQRGRAELHRLESVDSPHNHGKAGSLLLSQGRPGKAIPHLERAVAGEQEVVEWRYRLGSALLRKRRHGEAADQLRICSDMEEEHAYGAVQMRLAEALLGDAKPDEALAALDTRDRNHGQSPESAYRRGLTLKALGRRGEAKESLAEVAKLARSVAKYQRRAANVWVLRAWLARLA